MLFYDKQQVKDALLEICEHYLGAGKRVGVRTQWVCRGCQKPKFEANPEAEKAGCWNDACGVPRFTDALGLIAHFEELTLAGSDFTRVLKRGYEILQIPEPDKERAALGREIHPRDVRPAAGRSSPQKHGKEVERGSTPAGQTSQRAAEETGFGGRSVSDLKEEISDKATESPQPPRSEDGDGQAPACSSGESRRAAEHPSEENDGNKPKENLPERECELSGVELCSAVYEVLLALCPVDEEGLRFWSSRGVSAETVHEGRFGSITAGLARKVVGELAERFGKEALLGVPGFSESARGEDRGGLAFTLTGDYALIPYHDSSGCITTVEGRAMGAPGRGMGKYVSLRDSGSHLYVFPRFHPEQVEAFCEGPIGAIVAAQSGIAVGAIQGFRRYKAGAGSEDPGGPLPELAGTDFGGRQVPYIPDVDNPPKQEVTDEAPRAARHLVAAQNGAAALARLPGGEEVQDLDEWLLSLPSLERRACFSDLLGRAIPLADTGLRERCEGGAEAEEFAQESAGGSACEARGSESGPAEGTPLRDKGGTLTVRANQEAAAPEEYKDPPAPGNAKRRGPDKNNGGAASHAQRGDLPYEGLITFGEWLVATVTAVAVGCVLYVVIPLLAARVSLPEAVEAQRDLIALMGGVSAGTYLWLLRRMRRLMKARHLRGELPT